MLHDLYLSLFETCYKLTSTDDCPPNTTMLPKNQRVSCYATGSRRVSCYVTGSLRVSYYATGDPRVPYYVPGADGYRTTFVSLRATKIVLGWVKSFTR